MKRIMIACVALAAFAAPALAADGATYELKVSRATKLLPIANEPCWIFSPPTPPATACVVGGNGSALNGLASLIRRLRQARAPHAVQSSQPSRVGAETQSNFRLPHTILQPPPHQRWRFSSGSARHTEWHRLTKLFRSVAAMFA